MGESPVYLRGLVATHLTIFLDTQKTPARVNGRHFKAKQNASQNDRVNKQHTGTGPVAVHNNDWP